MPLSRRQFLAGAGAAALAAATGCWSRDEARVTGPRRAGDGEPWDGVRESFVLAPDHIHLAGLLLASHPRPVREAIRRHRQGLDENPALYVERHHNDLEARARAAAARYLGARPTDVALTDSTTMGLGLIYNGLRLRSGQDLLTTEDDYSATHDALRAAAARAGASTRIVPLYRSLEEVTAEEIADRILGEVRPQTRLVALTWVHSKTGLKIPIRRIADGLARINAGRSEGDRVLMGVDGVHALGVEDFEVDALGCDFFIAGTHKWLFGPRGTGIVWGHPRAHDAVAPLIPTFTGGAGWGGQMTPGGFHSFEHRWALTEAFEFHRALDRARVAGRIRALAGRLKERLAGMRRVRLYTPLAPDLSSGIVCFGVEGMSPWDVVRRLRDRRVVASVTPYAPPYARFAPGLLNTTGEIDETLQALAAVI